VVVGGTHWNSIQISLPMAIDGLIILDPAGYGSPSLFL